MDSKNALMIFTKNPVLGKVKTRLAAGIGEQAALKVYMQLLKHTREITMDIDFSDKMIFYDDFIPAKDNWKEDIYDKYLQGEGDLAKKMENAFSNAFDEGYDKVMIMSPDCPELTTLKLKQAFTLLNKHDFVLGPLRDGGYYLLGMKEHTPEVLRDIEFSESSVFEETLKRIESMGKTVKILPELYDVDEEADLDNKLRKAVGLEETTASVSDADIEEYKPDPVDEEEFEEEEEIEVEAKDDAAEDDDED